MENDKKSFMFYRSWFDSLDDLPDDTQLILYRAITHYAFLNEEPKLNKFLMFGFNQIKDQIDRDNDKWEDKREKRRQAGILGNQKRWGDKSQTIANAKSESQTIANIADNVDVDVNVDVDANVDVDVDVDVTHKCVCEKEKEKDHTHTPSLSDVQEYANIKGYSPAQAELFFNFYEGNGWKGVSNWRSKFTYWCKSDAKSKGYQLEQQAQAQRSESNALQERLKSNKANRRSPQESQQIFQSWMQDNGYTEVNQDVLDKFKQYSLNQK